MLLEITDWLHRIQVTAGRLEVFVGGQWGTVCNRSWSEQLARLACNQLGLIMDSEYFENWRIFPSAGNLPMVMDNIRCEEREYDLTQCRHDGVTHNLASSCASTEVVGIRCAEPRWAGVRYSLLANPPAITGQTSMDNWIIEKAGLFDFRIIYFEIRGGIGNNLKIAVKGILNSNRFRYNPRISTSLQRDIVTWLERREQPEMEANNVFTIPNRNFTTISVHESQLNQRKFLLARTTSDCPFVSLDELQDVEVCSHRFIALLDPCVYEVSLKASGFEYGLSSRIAIQILGNLELRYTRTYGNPEVVLLVLFLDEELKVYLRSTDGIVVLTQEYLDRFVHVYRSVIQTNQYGLSSVHYSDFNFADGTILNRWSVEKLWFQK
uniref:SRCR domain-containing protein n=1 Tax=Parascaris equorum TaxID=6256 RepID=A0A914RU07_PAREQ